MKEMWSIIPIYKPNCLYTFLNWVSHTGIQDHIEGLVPPLKFLVYVTCYFYFKQHKKFIHCCLIEQYFGYYSSNPNTSELRPCHIRSINILGFFVF